MVILDSNVIIRILKGDKDTLEKVGSIPGGIATTVFNLYELTRIRNRQKVRKFLERFIIYPFNVKEADLASEIYLKLSSSGKMKSEIDILIASIAKSNDEVLVTFDRDFYDISKIADLKVIIL
jgi:predicted nucleic acid-binding protein